MWYFERKPNSFLACPPSLPSPTRPSCSPCSKHTDPLLLLECAKCVLSSEPSPLLFPLPFPTSAELLPQFKNVTLWERSFLIVWVTQCIWDNSITLSSTFCAALTSFGNGWSFPYLLSFTGHWSTRKRALEGEPGLSCECLTLTPQHSPGSVQKGLGWGQNRSSRGGEMVLGCPGCSQVELLLPRSCWEPTLSHSFWKAIWQFGSGSWNSRTQYWSKLVFLLRA